MQFDFTAPCYFGLESAAAFDFRRLGAENLKITDGRVTFTGDARLLADANLWSRCAERIMIKLAAFPAATFDELFDRVYAIPWEDYIPRNGKFPVKGSSLSSTLSSVPACQSIVKKAVVERLRKGHRVEFLPERSEEYRIRFSIRKDMAEVFLDTSGDGLHKRGYRRLAGGAPLKETLAAAMADFGRVRRDSRVEDPFCGSGTLVIEAALKALNIAPGLRRSFAAEHYAFLPEGLFAEARAAAEAEKKTDAAFAGAGFDIDPEMVALAAANAEKAGVGSVCRFEARDVAAYRADSSALMMTNPPYGERLLDAGAAAKLEQALGRATAAAPPASAYVITADAEFERHFGRVAKKRRKVYNGMIPCQIYMYY
ncbi:class I SAM-dependent RNA methyltransferase [Ruminococcaceae bacterium OttesenSCG-928-D13]|nr:class I SAM-dependent RNA methyltransferase [Ruminococcaceae bacterium OttesenSCG-928-D13]